MTKQHDDTRRRIAAETEAFLKSGKRIYQADDSETGDKYLIAIMKGEKVGPQSITYRKDK